ncbi:MAG: amidohydrolase family protein [Myxococcales bacterium]|nr:amidohydrolase family protein [Myxococcales bacterium]
MLRPLSLVALLLSLGACRSPAVSNTGTGASGGTTSTTSQGGGGTGAVGAGGTGAVGAGGTGAVGAGGTGAVGAGGSGATGGSGPDGYIVSQGDPDKILLRGWVLTPDQSFAGEVLVVGDTLACVAADCSGDPNAGAASVVETNGIILPGLIDAHNHILFDIFDETDWAPTQAYNNHNQWTNEARYSAMVDAKQWLNGEFGSPLSLNCELNKYGELKALVSGTTSVVGAANPTNSACYRTLARTIDQSANGLCGGYPPPSCNDDVQVSTLFPPSNPDGVCANFTAGTTDAYIVHVAEGVDQTARNEFNTLRTCTAVDGCLFDPKTSIVHGTALTATEFDQMATAGMGLVWSPRSNVFLYGAGTDLTKTTNIPYARSQGLRVAIAPDWSMGGSQNMLDEMRFGDHVDNQAWGNVLGADDLLAMATSTPAALLGLSAEIGRLAVGLKADVTVVGGDVGAPYAAVLAATPREVRLVLVGGVVLYGDDQLEPLAPQAPGCDAFDACGRAKFLCVAASGGGAGDKFGQTLADITNVLTTELTAYDAQNLTQWDFAPLTPLVRCQ